MKWNYVTIINSVPAEIIEMLLIIEPYKVHFESLSILLTLIWLIQFEKKENSLKQLLNFTFNGQHTNNDWNMKTCDLSK